MYFQSGTHHSTLKDDPAQFTAHSVVAPKDRPRLVRCTAPRPDLNEIQAVAADQGSELLASVQLVGPVCSSPLLSAHFDPTGKMLHTGRLLASCLVVRAIRPPRAIVSFPFGPRQHPWLARAGHSGEGFNAPLNRRRGSANERIGCRAFTFFNFWPPLPPPPQPKMRPYHRWRSGTARGPVRPASRP